MPGELLVRTGGQVDEGGGSVDVLETYESRVRYYCRRWPAVFARAEGARLYDEDGREYLDFFAGAATLNYGHNPPELVEAVIDYLRSGGLVHGLDTATVAKREFVRALSDVVLAPRGLDYRIQFTGPTGTSAVEAALRVARKATGRRRVVCLTGAYHGMTVDSIAVSDISGPAGLPTLDPAGVTRVPHEMDAPGTEHALAALASALDGPDGAPAAFVVETLQGEGGVRPLSARYLSEAQALCRRTGTILIVDDIQAGGGRTGPFFSFESAGLRPDVVCLSKSISGLGLPLSLVLIAPELDVWAPGEHSGTFRGNQLAFVTGALAIRRWWRTEHLRREVERKSALLAEELSTLDDDGECLAGPVRGRGLLLGLPCRSRGVADLVARYAFEQGLLLETCGRDGEVLKLCPPLTVTDAELRRGVGTLAAALRRAGDRHGAGQVVAVRPG
nr:diaminobutyrate--2-oxoglutarate transaminase [Plantactinospora sp. BC1]